MGISLSDQEAAILLGAGLMHWGVPFHFCAKHELSDEQQATLEAASDKLVALREAAHRSGVAGHDVDLTDEEIAVLIEVVNNCLCECGDDPIELHLQLKTRDRMDVDSLLRRLKSLRGSPQCSP
jgi:hypothetical protein